jgi:hypothetical protein
MLDLPIELDMAPVEQAIATAEVLTIFFPWFGKAVVFDTRHRPAVPPLLVAADMVGSAEERVRDLMRRRPALPRPARLTAIPWPAGTNSFVDTGAYDSLVRRCYRLGHGELETDCRRALAIVRAAEQRLKLAYVRGEHCRTLYQAR